MKRKLIKSTIFLIVHLYFTNAAYSAVITLNPEMSIQAAIEQALPGDIVFLLEGLYPQDVGIINKNGVTLKGESYNKVTVKGKIILEDANASVENLTVQYGEGSFLSYSNSQYSNWNLYADSGIVVVNSNLTLRHCIIQPNADYLTEKNLDHYGRAIQIWNIYNNPDIFPDVDNNLIRDAECGIYCFAQAFSGSIVGEIKNNTFYHNKNGIILRMHKEKPEIKNNIMVGGDTGLFLTYKDGLLFDERRQLTHHNDVWAYLRSYWLDAENLEFDLTGIGGNISEDPLFVNPSNLNFSLDVNSPCKGGADDGGDMGRRLAPPPPKVYPLPPSINRQHVSIEGTKDVNTSILINGNEVIALNNEITWQVISYDLGSGDGERMLIISSKDIYGQESEAVIVKIRLDTTPPEISIISPLNGAVIHEAPITVTGTINEPCDVLVNSVLASISGTTFTADRVDLRYGENTITATAFDSAGNTSEYTIIVTSTATSDYNLIKLTPDVYEYDPTNVIAGSQIPLTVRLEIDGVPASNEPVEFLVTGGSGSLAQSLIYTNTSGEATAILNTDTDASITNSVEAFCKNLPEKKVRFHIDTKEGSPANLIKLTDESIHPAPGSEIDLTVRLTDSNNNPIPNEGITFQITNGPGTLSASSASTDSYGNSKVTLITTTSPNMQCTIQAQSMSNPSLIVTFNITTSAPLSITANDVIAKVIENDRLIQDAIADVTITSNASWAPPVTQLKIWQKGDKQKVQEISPEPGIYIRPATETGQPINMARTIMSYEPATNIYVIKSIQEEQTAEYPYQIDHIDYNKGVIIKSERYLKDGDYLTHFITEYSDFVNIDGIWGFRTMVETAYDSAGTQLYKTTSSYSNIQLNTGIPDSEFE